VSFSKRSTSVLFAALCAAGSLSLAASPVFAAPVDHTSKTLHKTAQSKAQICTKLIPVHYQPLGRYNDAWKKMDVPC
jgi:hypothetical protein